MILDGRNRFRACHAAQQPVRLQPFDGGDPAAFVISLNLRRRHLDMHQRGMVAAKLATLPRGANQHVSADTPSQEEAAELLNVSRPTVARAKAVLDKGTAELVHAVESGEIAIAPAAEIARLPAEEQPAAIVAHNHRAQGTGESRFDFSLGSVDIYRQAMMPAAMRMAAL